VTHLVDTSVWHQYGRNKAVQQVVQKIVGAGALLTTCPVVITEYCFSARTATELDDLQADMALLYALESNSLTGRVNEIQTALWSTGRVRAAGSLDCVIAGYALEHDQILLTCDEDFLHISKALTQMKAEKQLRVIHVKSDGSVENFVP